MGLKDKYDFSILVNETEEVVMEELEKQLNKEEYQTVCRCEECIMDMMALALNQLQPSYRSSFTGVIYAQKLHDGAFKEKVSAIVKKAVEKISQNPAHVG
ncbi:MAG: late competence development ComFB family protein [Spirochaetes bacterium]|nr:late competence development ComFB family protein [Spirochaetota bacterium]